MGGSLAPTRVDRLSNGMRVLTRELHHAPVACVMVWYGVGSRNEEPGKTGLSHFLEHMMFKGTQRFPHGALEEGVKLRGGMWNAFTSYDYTAYYEVLPARHLEYGLQVEADRMVNMTFDPDLAVRERGIIVSEREGRENSPHFWLFESFMNEAYRQFPYRHAVLGSKDDIRGTTAEALTAHYRRYYRPNNATLVVAGDFATDRLLALAEKHFGHLEAGAGVERLAVREPEQDEERRVTVRRPGPNPYFMAGYKIPGSDHPDQAALTILAAVLSGGPSFAMMGGGASMGRSSRLYRKLVNAGIAISASGQPWSLEYPGLFLFSGTPVTGVPLAKLEAAMFDEVEALRQEQVPQDELERAKKQVRAQFVYGMESAMSQATLLGSTAMTSGVKRFDRSLEEFEAVTAGDVLRVAQAYLAPDRRTIGWFEPEAKPAQVAGIASAEAGAAAPGTQPSQPAGSAPSPGEPTPGTTPPYQRPESEAKAEPPKPGKRGPILDTERIVRSDLPGAAGAALLVYPAQSIPSVLVRVQIEAGAVHDPAGKEGLSQLTAQLLNRGSEAFTADELALKTDALGMSIRVDIGRETAVGTLKCLPEDLETGLGLLAEVIRRPSFPAPEIDRMRERLLVAVRESNNDTRSVASRELMEQLYPEGHPYRSRASGTEESLKGLTRDDLAAFHGQHYGPAGATVAVVGNVGAGQVREAFLRAFDGWTGGAGRVQIPPAPAPEHVRKHVTVPGKSQTDIALGWPAVARSHPDFLALDFLATLFGGNGTPATSRLFRDVRERYGLSYYQFASFAGAPGPSPWTAHIGVNPTRLDFAVETMNKELGRLSAEPVPAEEMAALKAFLEDYPAVQHESPERVAARLSELERLGLGLDYLERHAALIGALTAEELQAAASRHLRLDRLSVVTAGPEPEQPE
ncbi:MAG: peptidase [Firmicutes bacterium]|nr:peptidase [Bacillota bacterium]